MEFLAILLGIIGNVLTVAVYTSPVSTFWKILKKRSTESFSAFPYECSLLNNLLWLYYGILDPNGLLLVTITSVGCAFAVVYISLYLGCATKAQRISVIQHLSIIIFIVLGITAFTMKFSHGNSRLRIAGVFCSINSVCMYASPLSIARMVITTKSVEYMPFLLSLSLLLCSGSWLGYAVVVKDLFVAVPNGIGFVLGFIQLALYAYYSRRGRTNQKATGLPCSCDNQRQGKDQKATGLPCSCDNQRQGKDQKATGLPCSCDNQRQGKDQMAIHRCKLEEWVDPESGHVVPYQKQMQSSESQKRANL